MSTIDIGIGSICRALTPTVHDDQPRGEHREQKFAFRVYEWGGGGGGGGLHYRVYINIYIPKYSIYTYSEDLDLILR